MANFQPESQKTKSANIKGPDIATEQLQKGFQWSAEHLQLVFGASGAVLLILALIFGWNSLEKSREQSRQGDLYQIEKDYLKKKEGFEVALKESDVDAKPKDPKADKKVEPVKKAKATGDLEKDFGKEISALKGFLEKNSGTTSGAIAALHLADVLSQYKKNDEAAAELQKAKFDSGMAGGLINYKLGSIAAQKKDCATADTYFNKVLNNKEASFLVGEISIQKGLCLENAGDLAGAEKAYQEVVDKKKDSPQAKTAEQYIRSLYLKGK